MPDKFPGASTFVGYSGKIIVGKYYILTIPENLNLAPTTPLLCARITIAGIGDLGYMGIKIAKAMGAHAVAFTISESKFAEAKRFGTDGVVPDHIAANII